MENCGSIRNLRHFQKQVMNQTQKSDAAYILHTSLDKEPASTTT